MRLASDWFARDVPLDLLRHNDTPVYAREGYGGRPIAAWPIYGFIRAYSDGFAEVARREFAAWYGEQLAKHQDVPVALGGMSRGSLYRAIEAAHRAGGVELNGSLRHAREEIVAACIAERVEQRLALVDAIRKEGYVPERAGRVMAIRKGGGVYLKGGHHRAAILKALGHETFPGLVVLPRPLYALVRRASTRDR
jgi:hypothetical protein